MNLRVSGFIASTFEAKYPKQQILLLTREPLFILCVRLLRNKFITERGKYGEVFSMYIKTFGESP